MRHVAELLQSAEVPAYTEPDSGLLWQVRPSPELSLQGRNLLTDVGSRLCAYSGFKRPLDGLRAWVP